MFNLVVVHLGQWQWLTHVDCQSKTPIHHLTEKVCFNVRYLVYSILSTHYEIYMYTVYTNIFWIVSWFSFTLLWRKHLYNMFQLDWNHHTSDTFLRWQYKFIRPKPSSLNYSNPSPWQHFWYQYVWFMCFLSAEWLDFNTFPQATSTQPLEQDTARQWICRSAWSVKPQKRSTQRGDWWWLGEKTNTLW